MPHIPLPVSRLGVLPDHKAESKAVFGKVRTEDRLHHLLDESLHNRGNAPLSHSLTSGLGDFYLPNQLRLIAPFQHFLLDAQPVFPKEKDAGL